MVTARVVLMREKIVSAVEEFNEFKSPEATAVLNEISSDGRSFEVEFTGHFCYTCGLDDYFDDFLLLLEKRGLNYSVVGKEEALEGYTVKFALGEGGSLAEKIEELKTSEAKKTVDERVKEFERVGGSSSEKIFSELCFCILTANFNAERTIRIQNEMGKSGFLDLSEQELASGLKRLGHRFPNARAKYIFEARKFASGLKEKISSFEDERKARGWLVENVKGLGFKEASHFLRNIGFKHVAIIDFHIIDLLVRNDLVEKQKGKSLPKKKYLEIEKILEELARKAGLNLSELDLCLWFLETGKLLK